jgi:PRTRC genetic system protein E
VVAVDLVCEQRSVLLTVTLVEDDQVRVNVMPKKLADSENNALTTPMSFTGTAPELDEQLPAAIGSFVASHRQLKNTLEKAKEEMAAAAKAAQEEARNKAKSAKNGNDTAAKATATEKKDAENKEEEETKAPTSLSLLGLFDAPAAAAAPPAPVSVKPVSSAVETDEERELLTEISEDECDDDDTREAA